MKVKPVKVLKHKVQRARLRAQEAGLFASSTMVLVLGGVILVFAFLGFSVSLHHPFPWDKNLTENNAASSLDITKIALSLVAGVGAAIALTVTYRKQRDAEKSSFDERFGSAATHLGAKSLPQQIGGVYSLASLGDGSVERRQQYADLLCAYIRFTSHSEVAPLKAADSEDLPQIKSATDQVQRLDKRQANNREVCRTIIDVIRLRLQENAENRWNKIAFDFRGVTFENCNLEGACFERETSFERATFSGVTLFNDATFNDSVSFYNTKFDYAYFKNTKFNQFTSFESAAFKEESNFNDATFNDSVSFSPIWLYGESQFTGATFNGPTSFEGATFNGVANFSGVSITGAEYRQLATFEGATFNQTAEFSYTKFNVDTSFRNAKFNGARSFEGAEFMDKFINLNGETFRDHLPSWLRERGATTVSGE